MDTKICKKCGIEKDISNFSKQAKAADGFFSWCRECSKKYRHEKYHNNIEDSRNRTNKKRIDRVRWFREFKDGKPCLDCGKIYEPSCMDYDHIPGNKKINNVSSMVIHNYSENSILQEIEKCELVCVYCHNKRTYNRLSETKYRPSQLRNIEIINKFKDKDCIWCGHKYEHYNMQLDHIDSSTRLDYVCNLKSCKEEILREELTKCQVLCAMCHRRKSLIEQKMGKYTKREKEKVNKREELYFDLENKTKECSVCHDIKSFDDFYNQKKAKYGLSPSCRDCLNIAKKKKRGTLEKSLLSSDNKKKCSKCLTDKDICSFNKRTDGGLSSWCKDCYNCYRRECRASKKI